MIYKSVHLLERYFLTFKDSISLKMYKMNPQDEN